MKEYVLLNAGIVTTPVTKRLLSFIAKSRQSYYTHLEEKKFEEKQSEKRKCDFVDVISKKPKTKDELADIKNSLLEERVKLQSAQKLIADGTTKLTKASNAKTLSKKDILESRSLLNMGISASQAAQAKIDSLLLQEKKLLETKSKKR